MQNEKNELPLLNFPRELIFLIASFLDPKSLLKLRLMNKLLEEITQPLLFKIAKNNLLSDKIACGSSSVILTRFNGQQWAWGDNSYNELALTNYQTLLLNNITNYRSLLLSNIHIFTSPKKTLLNDVDETAVGKQFTLAKIKNGTVYSSGINNSGQLGLDETNIIHTNPQIIPSLSKVTKIAAGFNFGLAITEDEKLYSWGGNDYGQLGHGNTENYSKPKEISSIEKVDKIAACEYFSTALTKSGDLYLWGQLGLSYTLTPKKETAIKDVTSISAGKDFIMALKNDGTIFTWKINELGKLDAGIVVPDVKNIVKISVYGYCCLALSYDGLVYSWNQSQTPITPQQIIGLKKIVEIGQGSNFSVALDINDTVHSWGSNEKGQLGIGIGVERDLFDTPQRAWYFEKPVKSLFFNSVTRRLAEARFAKTLKLEQKASQIQDLTTEKDRIVEETKTEVFTFMMKRNN